MAEDVDSIEDLISQSDIIMLQLEIPLDTICRVVEIAKIHGKKVILNPAPVCSLSDELLSKIDVLTPNESKCEALTGVKSDTIEGAKEAAKQLLSRGVKQVVITMGNNGVTYSNNTKIIHKSARKVVAVDTIAAGDSFSGALAYCLSNDIKIDESIEFAATVGALTVTKNGAQNSLPFMEEVKSFVR